MELSGDGMGGGELAPVTITWSCVFLNHNLKLSLNRALLKWSFRKVATLHWRLLLRPLVLCRVRMEQPGAGDSAVSRLQRVGPVHGHICTVHIQRTFTYRLSQHLQLKKASALYCTLYMTVHMCMCICCAYWLLNL